MPEKPKFPHLLEGPDLSQRDDTLTQIVDTMSPLVDPILSADFPGEVCIRSDVVSRTMDRAFDAGVLAAIRSLSRAAADSGVDITSLFAEVVKAAPDPSMSRLSSYLGEYKEK